jgi:hypothetical protein
VEHLTAFGPDAALIGICAQHIVNLAAANANPAMEKLGYDDNDDPLWAAYQATRDAITGARPKTIEGMAAIARAAMAEAGPDRGAESRSFCSMEEHWSWNLMLDLLRIHGEDESDLGAAEDEGPQL